MKIIKISDKNNKIDEIIKYFSSKYNLASGNCGMFAIALGKYFEKYEGMKAELVFVTNLRAGEKLTMYSDIDLYHVAVSLNGQIYDYRGKITESSLASFASEVYGNNSPKIDYFFINNASITFVRQNTRYDLTHQSLLSEIIKFKNEKKLKNENISDN